MERNRTAPVAWGSWPPSQNRVLEIVDRACRKLREQIAEEPWINGTILMCRPRTTDQLDCSFSGREGEIDVGEIWAIGQKKSWTVFWDPVTDTGRLASNGHYDWRA